MISALNFDTGPTASWNDGFHPNQYLLASSAGATVWGNSNNFPFGATVQYIIWGRRGQNMDTRSDFFKQNDVFRKRISLAFKFRIAIDHPQDPGRLMFGPYSETLLIRPELGRFTYTPGFAGEFYYGWYAKVK
jgi:hypothetical protein